MPCGGKALVVAVSLCATALLGVGYCYYQDLEAASPPDSRKRTAQHREKRRRKSSPRPGRTSAHAENIPVFNRQQLVPISKASSTTNGSHSKALSIEPTAPVAAAAPSTGRWSEGRAGSTCGGQRKQEHAFFLSSRLDNIFNRNLIGGGERSGSSRSSRILLYKSIYAVRDLRARGGGSSKMRPLLSRRDHCPPVAGLPGRWCEWSDTVSRNRCSDNGQRRLHRTPSSHADKSSYSNTTSWQSQLMVVKRVTYQCIA